MLLILFRRRYKTIGEPIELCGLYKDMDHFYRAEQVENQRGWYLVGVPEILKTVELQEVADAR